jgi:hypothetical protein
MAASFLGALTGYAPLLALHLFALGFTAAFIDSVKLIFEAGTTNFPLPFPSVFAIARIVENPLMGPTETALALLFLGVPLLWAAVAWRLRYADFRAALPPQSLAAFLLSLPYAHYAYSRADAPHVAISILPILVFVLTKAIRAQRRHCWLVLSSALAGSLLITAHMHPVYPRLRGLLPETVKTGSDRLLVAPETAAVVQAVQSVAKAAGAGSFYAGPYLPAAYALTNRRSPTWENYMIFPASLPRQRAEVERLRSADIRYAIIRDERWDRRSDLGLERTHPLVLAFLDKCLSQVRRIPTGANPLVVRSRGRAYCDGKAASTRLPPL